MGEKSGGLWLIVIVVVLAGLLIAGLTVFFPDAIEGITGMFDGMLNDVEYDTAPKPSGSGS